MPIVASTAATANAVTAWAARSARPWLESAARWTPCAPTLRGSAGAAVARDFRESFDMRRGELRRGERGPAPSVHPHHDRVGGRDQTAAVPDLPPLPQLPGRGISPRRSSAAGRTPTAGRPWAPGESARAAALLTRRGHLSRDVEVYTRNVARYAVLMQRDVIAEHVYGIRYKQAADRADAYSKGGAVGGSRGGVVRPSDTGHGGQ